MSRGKLNRSIRRSRPLMRLEPIEPRVLLATISGHIFDDLDGDGLKDAGENGLIGKMVYIDADANGQLLTNAPVTSTNNTDKTITDNSTTLFTVSVGTQSSPIVRIEATVNIVHTYVADLDVWLISPSGTRVELFTDINLGRPTTGMAVTFDDSAATSIAGATGTSLSGTWRPEGLLGTFAGQSATGTWTLEVNDTQPNDTGFVNSVSLRITTGERAAVTNASGNYTLTSVSTGTQRVQQFLPTGWESTAPAGGLHTVSVPNSASNLTGRDFGTRMTPGRIGGTVFADYNHNGVHEASEPGQSGWTVYIDSDTDGVLDAGERSTTSGSDGTYLFIDIKPGPHVVREVLPAGWTQTTPNGAAAVVVAAGAQATAGGAGAAPEGRAIDAGSIVVAFHGDDGLGALRKLRRAPALGAYFDLGRSEDLFSVDGLSLVNVTLPGGVDPLKAVARFSNVGTVAWAQPNYSYTADPRELTPNDPSYGSQYHHTLMKNNLAWDTTLGSADVVIAVTDDGVSLSHPDLAPNIWVNSDEIAGNGLDDDANGYVDDVNGWDFSSNDNNPNPIGTMDHGTHVAGIAAARTNNALGVAGTAGGAKIMPIRFYGSATWTSTIIANSFRYAADNGARILNTSYNIDSFVGDSIFASALQYIYDRGVLYLNSAGNNNQLNPPRQVFDHALFVANTTSSDVRSGSSNYGWGIDISAPGSSILSTVLGNGYGTKSGTSMSTPNAAGVAALIWSVHPTWTRDQVAAQLIGSADSVNAQNPSFVNLLGSGRVNSFRGVTQQLAPPRIRSLTGLPTEGSTVLGMPYSFTLDVASVFNPATVTAGSFELRGDGTDDIFGTPDDRLMSISLNTTYRIGTNRLQFTVSGVPENDRYRFSSLTTLTDPFGQSIDGNSDGAGGDAYIRTFTLAALTNPIVVTVESLQTALGNFGNAQTASPKVVSASFGYLNDQRLTVAFDLDVGPSLNAADLVLQRLGSGGGTTYPIDALYDAQTRTATFRLGDGSEILADGNYVATIDSDALTDIFGNPLDGDGNGLGGDDFVFSFFVLGADANHDRLVDVRDLQRMAANYLQSGKTFAEGDFNYDGIVDAADLTIMAQRWNQTLTSPISPPATESQPPVVRTRAPVRSAFSDPSSLLR